MTHVAQEQSSVGGGVLAVAFELAARSWRLASGTGHGQSWRQKSLERKHFEALRSGLLQELEKAKKRFGLPLSAKVVACYEAGRDGHWVRRFLESLGVECYPIHASSTQVDRRQRRAKTDRLDAAMLLKHLLSYLAGDHSVFRVIHPLGEEAEDARHLSRHQEVLQRDKSAIGNRIRSVLAGEGVFGDVRLTRSLRDELDKLLRWDGSPLPPGVLSRLQEEVDRWVQLDDRIRAIKERRRELAARGAFGSDDAARLQRLKSLGEELTWPLALEGLGYRGFTNGRQVGAYMGLAPTPYASGQSRRELGIGHDGNRRLRWRAIEASWLWLRYQPTSALSLWYQKRFGAGSSRLRRIGIVALARKLMVALWRYLDQGVVPTGAILKP